jgi:2-keto-4-pentenoate hydratase
MVDVTEPFDPAPAAAMLAEAWRSGTLMQELPPAIRPRSLGQGYDIQDRLIAGLGDQVVGWKLGVGSAAQKRQSGIGRSIAGRLLGSHVYRPGDTIALANAAPVTIEFEIAYILRRDVLPDEAAFPLLQAVGDVHVAFELVRSRFVDRRAVGWPSFAADDAGFQALVLGPPIDPARLGELRHSLVVTLDGKEAATSLSGEDATDPEAALADLVATARERGMVLPNGSIVSTGTVSKPFDIASPAAAISARFLGTELGFRTKAGRAAPDQIRNT